jgi:hypothetical protein
MSPKTSTETVAPWPEFIRNEEMIIAESDGKNWKTIFLKQCPTDVNDTLDTLGKYFMK